MFLLMLVTVPFVPLVLPWFLRGTSVMRGASPGRWCSSSSFPPPSHSARALAAQRRARRAAVGGAHRRADLYAVIIVTVLATCRTC